MKLRKLLFTAAVTVLWAGLVPLCWSSQTGDPGAKISSRVLSETSNGGVTEALVVLAQQADLSPANNLTTKLEKGRFVVNTLRSVAQSVPRSHSCSAAATRHSLSVLLYRQHD